MEASRLNVWGEGFRLRAVVVLIFLLNLILGCQRPIAILRSESSLLAESENSGLINDEQLPLKRIWAYEISGTRGYLLEEILRSSTSTNGDGRIQSFVVPAQGLDALIEIHSIEVDSQSAQNQFCIDDPMSLIVLAKHSRSTLTLVTVTRSGNDFTATYAVAPNSPPQRHHVQFAIFPLEHLPVGTYRVSGKLASNITIEATARANASDNNNAIAPLMPRAYTFSVNARAPGTVVHGNATKVNADESPNGAIWGYDVPGTRDVQRLVSLETFKDGRGEYMPLDIRHGPVVDEVRRALSVATQRLVRSESADTPTTDAHAAGFVVESTGVDALQQARSILNGLRDRPARVRSERDVSCVFFYGDHDSAFNLKLLGISRRGTDITITYSLPGAIIANRETTNQFAIISLGKLLPGQYQVRANRTPLADAQLEQIATDNDRYVCKSFAFVVEK